MVNCAESCVRARFEHVFGVVKRLRGFDKVCAIAPRPRTKRYFFVAMRLANTFHAPKRMEIFVRPQRANYALRKQQDAKSACFRVNPASQLRIGKSNQLIGIDELFSVALNLSEEQQNHKDD